jgi:predicted GTPase
LARTRVIITGGAGREFHDFNTYFRNRPQYEVVAFTVPKSAPTAGKRYPSELCGTDYRTGIPIETEDRLAELIRAHGVEEVVVSATDVPYADFMHRSSVVVAAGAGFRVLGPRQTQLRSERPVVAIAGVRTGSGKSPIARHVAASLKELGLRVAIVRHPIPSGDLEGRGVQRFGDEGALGAATLEEREEIAPHVDRGFPVFTGVDVEQALFAAEEHADVLLWECGTNDTPFVEPDLHITVCDPLRVGHEVRFHPGEANVRLAQVLVVNKVSTARAEDAQTLRARLAELNPKAVIVDVDSRIMTVNAEALRAKKALVLEDGPTLAQGGIGYGAGLIAAIAYKAEIVDPRPHAVGGLKERYGAHPEWQRVVPVMSLGSAALQEVADTIRAAAPEVVVVSTPADLREELRALGVTTPLVRVTYEVEERAGAPLKAEIAAWVGRVVRRADVTAAS